MECRSRRSGGRPGTVSALVRDLPVADLGCGNGRQTMFLGQHFTTVIGTDISPAAIEQARAARTLRTSDSASWISRWPDEAERLDSHVGDVNVYVRGVLHALPPGDRPGAVESISRLLGDTGTLFDKELAPEAYVLLRGGGGAVRRIARHGANDAPDTSRADE